MEHSSIQPNAID